MRHNSIEVELIKSVHVPEKNLWLEQGTFLEGTTVNDSLIVVTLGDARNYSDVFIHTDEFKPFVRSA